MSVVYPFKKMLLKKPLKPKKVNSMKKVGFVFVMALLASFPASAQDWPQYLGPEC